MYWSYFISRKQADIKKSKRSRRDKHLYKLQNKVSEQIQKPTEIGHEKHSSSTQIT